ncbi:hypothetical protein [Mycobacterium angelicum]|nr:hypothetical protein [Mycobacterium angelicum]MCV7198027.1 hypothetical protein [Mycobacterium angelicum]
MLPYEQRKSSPDGGATVNGTWDLPRDEWRYTVVRCVNPLITSWALTQALRLSDADIWTPIWGNGKHLPPDAAAKVGTSWFWSPSFNPDQAFQFASRPDTHRMPQCPDLDEIDEVVKLRRAFDDDQYPEVARALVLFIEGEALPEMSKQKCLAYFGVIESLLAHAPRPNDLVDSLTRQLTRNILLLNNRLPDHRKLGLDTFDRSGTAMGPDKVIKQLYAYRSAIAHGGDAADTLRWFDQHRPRSWTSIPQVDIQVFVRGMLKRLLIAAITEPQLVQDLKAA